MPQPRRRSASKKNTSRRRAPARRSPRKPDALQMLKQDHRMVEALFEEFEEADETEQSAIAQRVCQMLTVHAQIEEEILYPAAKQALEDEEEESLVNEAEVEHASAKELIAKIEGMTPDDEHFEATVKVLGEYVKHHVKEEEGEMFPKLKKTELDLKEVGGRLAERKYELMEQMGIQIEEEPETSRRRTSTTSKSRSGARSKRASSGGRSARAGARRASGSLS